MNTARLTTTQIQPLPPCLNESALVAYLATQPDIAAAYLFGSWATGGVHAQSDVDIAILLTRADDALAIAARRLQLINALAPFADCEMDVVILNTASTLLQHEVVRCRRLLYEADRMARLDFEVRAGKQYADEQPHRDFFAQAMFKEIQEGRFGGRR